MKQLENVTGYLLFEQVPCFFSFDDNSSILKICPEREHERAFENAVQSLSGDYNNLEWIFGKTSLEYDIAFFPSREQSNLSHYKSELALIVSIVITYNNIKGLDGNYLYKYKDLHGFTAIDFLGTPVDSCFSPNSAVNTVNASRDRIGFLPQNEYCKVYETELAGIKCNLIFTVEIDRMDLDPDTIELGCLRSILRLEFSERQNLSMIETCWEGVCTFLSFCIGQKNITNLQVSLSDENHIIGTFGHSGLIDCRICHDSVDDIQFRFSPYYRFQIDSMGEKVGRLFSLICNNETRPILEFLPSNNFDFAVDRRKIRELCTALEVEYDFRRNELNNPNIDALVHRLKETVKAYKKEFPDVIDPNSYSYIDSSLSVISRPARQKLCAIYFMYNEIIDRIGDFRSHTGEPINTSNEQTESDIAWIVKVRNNITHSTGITDAIIPNGIFFRLKLAVFCSALERAEYSKEEIYQIIKDYYNGVRFHN